MRGVFNQEKQNKQKNKQVSQISRKLSTGEEGYGFFFSQNFWHAGKSWSLTARSWPTRRQFLAVCHFLANNNSLVHKSPPIPDRCGLPFINYFKIFKSQPHDRRYASSVRKKKHQLTIRRTGRLIMRVGWGMCKAASKRIKFCKIAWQWLCFQIQTNNSK